MSHKVDQDNAILKAYLLANPTPHPVRDIPNELNELIEKQKVVPRITVKRKGTPIAATSSPNPKTQKKKKKSSKPALHDEDSE